MSAKHHKIFKVPLWFMASYSHSHSHRNISKAAMGRPHPACICSSCWGYFTCLKCLYVWLTSCLCVCVCELTPRSMSVCVCIYLGVVGPTSVLVLDLSRTVGPKPRQLCQSKTTRLCALCAVPRLPHRTHCLAPSAGPSHTHSGGVSASVCVCVRMRAAGIIIKCWYFILAFKLAFCVLRK